MKTIRHFWKKLKMQTNGKIFCAQGLDELVFFKCPHYPKQSIDAIPIKIPMVIFRQIGQNPKLCTESQKTLNSQSNLEKEDWEAWYFFISNSLIKN